MSKDLYKRRVKDVMVRDVVYINPQDSVDEALDLLVENRISALPVIDAHRRCVGFLSVTDFLGLGRDPEAGFNELTFQDEEAHSALLNRLRQPDLGNQRVQELMSESVFCVSPESPLHEAASEMIRNKVHRLAVVDGDQKLLGIVSTMDIIAAVADAVPA